MLSREDRIFSELLLERGLVARDLIERYAKTKSDPGPSLAEFLIDSGDVEKDDAEQVLSEARAIDESLLPHLSEGKKLGEFRLIREIGRGGMGIVFEAEQESLGRHVALKVLPAGAALDERLAIRFLREARVTARLQHPGIVPIFASGRAEGVLFFAMELVPGRSLAEIAAEGAVDPERAARVVAQVARALEHAHQAGLVHRDVKPENILIAPGDTARLTDFGLVHENVSGNLTLPRHVLGTPAYIAPEQAGGKGVDRRSDLYGLGAVLYTLLSGSPPYAGAVPSAVLAQVLTGPPPPLRSVNDAIPASLAAVCERAMAREPEDRYGSAREMAEALEAFLRGEPIRSATVAADAVVPASRRRRIVRTLGAVAAIVGILLIAKTSLRRFAEPTPEAGPLPGPQFTLLNDSPGRKAYPALSPNGNLLAYVSNVSGGWGVYLDDLTTHEITRIGGGMGKVAFSPDGRSLAFAGPGVSILDLESRAIRRFEGPGEGALAWSPDGREIVVTEGSGRLGFASVGRLWMFDVASGRIRLVRSMAAHEPAFSPHGSRLAFVSLVGGRSDVWTAPRASGDTVRFTDDAASEWSPFWSRNGRFLYFGSDRNGTPQLFRVGVDEALGLATGSPAPALDTVFPALFSASLSADGRRIVIANGGEGRGRLFRLRIDPASGSLSSRPEALPLNPAHARFPHPSPDGKFVVYTAFSPEEDLAIVTTDGYEEPRLLMSDAFEDRAPRWSPDGTRIAFHSNRGGNTEIWTVRPDGSELRRITETPNGSAVFPVWSPDGNRIAYSVEGAHAYVTTIPPSGTAPAPDALPLPGPGGRAFEPWSWSPDGGTLAGSADGVILYSIRDHTYRRLTSFGEKPVWLDGGHLLFASERSIFVIDCKRGEPRAVYSAAPSGLPPFLGVTGDGRSVYVSLTASNEEIWIADLPE